MVIKDYAQPIANLQYDLLTVLHNKAEAAKAYEFVSSYLENCNNKTYNSRKKSTNICNK